MQYNIVVLLNLLQIITCTILIGVVSKYGRKFRQVRALQNMLYVIYFASIFYFIGLLQKDTQIFLFVMRFFSLPLYLLVPVFISVFFISIAEWKPWEYHVTKFFFISIPVFLICVILIKPDILIERTEKIVFGHVIFWKPFFFLTFFHSAGCAAVKIYSIIMHYLKQKKKLFSLLILIASGLSALILGFVFTKVLPAFYREMPFAGTIPLLFIPIGGFFAVKLNPDFLTADQAFVAIEVLQHTEKKLQNAYDEVEIKIAQRTAEISEANRKLMTAKMTVEAVETLNRKILSEFSHQLRNPLNAIIEYAGLLSSSVNNGTDSKYAGIIKAESKKIDLLINKIFSITSAHGLTRSVFCGEFNLRMLLIEIETAFKPVCDSKKTFLRIYIDHAIPDILAGDEVTLRQILICFIGNALKHTDTDGIILKIKISRSLPVEIHLCFEVETDSGFIFPAETFCFDAEYPFENSEKLIKTMNGKTGLEKDTENKIIHWCVIPFGLSDKKKSHSCENRTAENTRNAHTAMGTRVLLAEDYAVNREVASFHLTAMGCTVLPAENGKEAVDIYINELPDMIFMDVRMPVMDGLTASRKIRALPEGKNVLIFGLTANVLLDDQQECINAGMNEVILKPFTYDKLFAAVSKFIQKQEGLNPSPATSNTRCVKVGGVQDEHRPPTRAEKATDQKQDASPIDLDKFIKDLGGDRAHCLGIIMRFSERALKQMTAVSVHTENEKWEEVAGAAHAVKGGALTIGALPLAESADVLEQKSRQPGEDKVRNAPDFKKEITLLTEKVLKEIARLRECVLYINITTGKPGDSGR